jgi:uncharacterized membrane protein HdeD (DUF308 family)
MSIGSTEPTGSGTRKDTYVSRHFVVAGSELQRASGLLFFLGVSLIVLGFLALMAPVIASTSLVIFYGWLLLFGGVAQTVVAIGSMRWGGFFLHLLVGLIDIVVGLFFLRHLIETVEALTLLLAAGFLIGGIFRMIGAISLRFPGWGWTVLSGAITFAVGVLLWAQWPSNSLVIPGLFFGIQLMFYGWSAVMLSAAARKQV